MGKQFMGGHAGTPREFFARTVWKNARCAAGNCSRHVTIEAKTFVPLDELRKRDPDFDFMARAMPKSITENLVQFQTGTGEPTPYVRVSTTYACHVHESDLQREAAKAPSWAVVEFQRGPSDQPIQMGWATELANANSITGARSKSAQEEGFRVTDSRSSAHVLEELGIIGEKKA